MAFLVDNLYILDTRKPQMHWKTPSSGGVIKRVVDVLQGDTLQFQDPRQWTISDRWVNFLLSVVWQLLTTSVKQEYENPLRDSMEQKTQAVLSNLLVLPTMCCVRNTNVKLGRGVTYYGPSSMLE